MLDQLRILAGYYYQPRRAIAQTLDQSSPWISFALAAFAALLLVFPGKYVENRIMTAGHQQRQRAIQIFETQGHLLPAEPGAFSSLTGHGARNGFAMLVLTAGAFVPTVIALLSRFARLASGFGSSYIPVLTCVLTAWTAAYLPAGILYAASLNIRALAPVLPYLLPISLAAFLILATLCLRITLGAPLAGAAISTAAGATVAAAASHLLGAVSGMIYYLASPFLLYYFLSRGGINMAGLGGDLRSRQSFRRHLETTTINPRDSDAHFQLGLIHAQRHQNSEAEACFLKAIEIDSTDADYHFHLGRLLRLQDRNEEALAPLTQAAQLNRRLSNYEVLRELGALYLALNQPHQAAEALEEFTDSRQYDPEGLVYLGQALASLGRAADARAAYLRAMEAADTMPAFRRGEVRHWRARAARATKELDRQA